MKLYLQITIILLVISGMASHLKDGKCHFFGCPLNWNPLCGKRGNEYRTFVNLCDFDRANCFAKPNYIFSSGGKCAKDSKIKNKE